MDITVEAEEDGTVTVLQNREPVAHGLSPNQATVVTGLLTRCHHGDQAACAELDELGIDPPVLPLDVEPVPCR